MTKPSEREAFIKDGDQWRPAKYRINVKTEQMLAIEAQYGMSIEDILTSGSTREIETKYGIPFSTAARWIKRLQLTTRISIPICERCVPDGECHKLGLCGMELSNK